MSEGRQAHAPLRSGTTFSPQGTQDPLKFIGAGLVAVVGIRCLFYSHTILLFPTTGRSPGLSAEGLPNQKHPPLKVDRKGINSTE